MSRERMKCAVCDDEDALLTWNDLRGEASCHRCGTPYLMPGFHGRSSSSSPELAVMQDALKDLRGYWAETKKKNGLGTFLDLPSAIATARREFFAWLETRDKAKKKEDAA